MSYSLTSTKLLEPFKEWPHRRYIDTYTDNLRRLGFSERHLHTAVRVVGEYVTWLSAHHGDQLDLNDGTGEDFVLWRKQLPNFRRGTRVAVRRFLALLRQVGAIDPEAEPADPQSQILNAYGADLAKRGYSAKSVANYVWFAKDCLPDLWLDGGDLANLTRTDVAAFVERQAPRRSPATGRSMCGALRSFLRYLRSIGIVADDLAAAVPTVKSWKHASLPTFLSADELGRVLQHVDRTTVAGRRDYAILLLLARLGLRANEVATLTLDDIDWSAGVFRISGKGDRRVTMPMPSEVGAAIADYIQHGRPHSAWREVFLRVETLATPFPSYAVVSLLARRALARAGISDLAHHHAHVFRHTVATAMINAGASLDEIGQLLRHQDSDTTRIYAKVDLQSLRLLARPWPEAVR